MENKTVYFYDPNTPNFGKLSNNYISPLYINEEKYSSVSHYIYSNLIPEFKEEIKNMDDPTQLPQTFTEVYNERRYQLIRASVIKALQIKIVDPEFRKILKSSGDAILLYKSNNTILGSGEDGKSGKNVYGNVLMELRDSIRKIDDDDRYINLYEIYNIITTLKQQLQRGNEIDTSIKENPTIDYRLFVELLLSGNLSDIDILKKSVKNPENIIPMVKKKYLNEYTEKLNSLKKLSLVMVYLTSIIKTKYPNVRDVDTALNQQLSNLNLKQKTELTDRLYRLYEYGVLPEEIMKRINTLYPPTSMDDPKIPDYQPVGDDYDFSELESNLDKSDIIEFYDPTGKWGKLSPRYMSLIYIDNLPYPSISHYIIINLFLTIPTDAYYFNALRTKLLKNPTKSQTDLSNYKDLNEISKDYDQTEKLLVNKFKFKLLNIALNVKFSDVEDVMVETLKNTGIASLIYNDPNDSYLGTGANSRGENITGNILSEIRKNKVKKEVPQPYRFTRRKAVISKYLLEYLNNDEELEKWVDMRMSDICRVIKIVNLYFLRVHKKETEINEDLADMVINKIYKSCSGTVKEKNTLIPTDFMERLNKHFDKEVSEKVGKIIWNYIDGLVTTLIKYKPQRYDTKTYLEKIQVVLSSTAYPDVCKGPYPKDIIYNMKNCMIKAIGHIRNSIKEYGKKVYNINYMDLNNDSLNTIIDIIIPKDMKKPELKDNLELSDIDRQASILIPSFERDKILSMILSLLDSYRQPSKFSKNQIVRLLFFAS